MIVGLDKADDAIAYQNNEEQIIIQSLDFSPIVDDPYMFGQIAAANALSDIYAMGGVPLTAMNVVGFPSCLDDSILSEILQGGADKVEEAGAIIAGGHTIEDDEPKYGLSVMGEVKPEQLLTNDNAQPGDKLILTKEIGMGIVTTAIKNDEAHAEAEEKVIEAMARLNNQAVKVMHDYNANSCTDITGFGLLGHAWELAKASQVAVKIQGEQVPLLPKALDYSEQGFIPGGTHSNRHYLSDNVTIADNIKQSLSHLLFDAQTSGGLLISVPGDKADSLVADLHSLGVTEAAVIGEVTSGQPNIVVE